jgi:cell division protein FtsI (penicillin-binding protein 3)
MRSRNLFSRRLIVIGACCVMAATAIVARMGYLKLVLGPELAGQAESITCGDTEKFAYRGPILDRNDAVLANTIGASQIAVRRALYVYDESHAARLAPLLGTDERELDELLRDDPRKFIYLTKSADVDASNAVQRLRIVGIDVYRNQRRSYPQGPLAAHVIGFTGTDAQGLEGVERVLDEGLRGMAQSIRVCKDVRGRVFYSTGDMTGMNRGAAVKLTVDATLQSIAETALGEQVEKYDAAGGSVVVLDPGTGAVLAMANAPSFDPNFYTESAVASRRNRAVTDFFEPGSTTKPLVIAAALDAGVITPTDVFFCENGALRIGGRVIHDHHPYGHLTVPEILKVSSNICSAKIGDRLGADSLHGYLRAFGFGRRAEVGLPGESAGLLSDPSRWRPINLANISFGQGLTTTALQMVSSFSVLANEGVRMRPYIVESVVDSDGTVVRVGEPKEEGRVVSAKVARMVSEMLEAVVAPGGTAPRASIEGIRIAGKTGTAQKVENGRYSKSKFVASFVGFLPADDPALVISVSVDEPKRNHYGGVVAAPIFRRIAEASLDYLHIHRVPQPAAGVVTIEANMPEPALPSIEEFDGTMPDLEGLSLRSAMRAMDGCECRVDVEGRGYVVAQQPDAGKVVERAEYVRLTLADTLSN